jgi:colanic acid/amylovoran biosynthesis glycosyltransferase
LNNVLIFAERMLPSTQTFIPIQVNALKRFSPHYVGLIPAQPAYALNLSPILLTNSRSLGSRVRREAYRWTGVAPSYHAQIRKLGAKLLHAHFAEGASSAVAISSALRIPMVLHLRGGAELLPDEELRRHAFQLPYLLWRRRVWSCASRFLCVSDYIRQKAIKAGFPADKVRVHYTGIDFSRFSPSPDIAGKDKNLVLFVGRLIPYKGADHLIRAMHIVRQSHPEAHLVVIGNGFFRPTLEALVHDLRVPCQFLGEQTPAVIRSWLERARVFCGPSITLSDGMSEAFGNVFTEAQAMGVPVVSYRHGGIPETMLDGETGLLANEGDHNQLAAHILRYLTDDGFWSRSRELGMTWVRDNFDVFKQTARLEDVYDEVIAAPEVHPS